MDSLNSNPQRVVLPPCRLLLEEVDAAARKTAMPLDAQPQHAHLSRGHLCYILNDVPNVSFDKNKDEASSFCSISSDGYDADNDPFYDNDANSCSTSSSRDSIPSSADFMDCPDLVPPKGIRQREDTSFASMKPNSESSISKESVIKPIKEGMGKASVTGVTAFKEKFPCTSKHCLKAQYMTSLIDRRASVPTPSRSSSTDSSITASSFASSESSVSVVEHGPDSEKIHFWLPVSYSAVEFLVPEEGEKSMGIAVDDILQSGGACIPAPDVPAHKYWRQTAKRGETINLTVHWKGYADEMLYPIQVKCDCGFDITRAQLALEIAQAQQLYFATHEIEESYREPAGNTDPFHRSKFIVKDHHSLRLILLQSPDLKGVTWRASHAIVDRDTFKLANPKPKPQPKKPHPSDALAQGLIPCVWVERRSCKCHNCNAVRVIRLAAEGEPNSG
ncbi:hypothetical protein Hypma_006213 [Hypsizygus marmoreus]|uniref:Uncharacterized protein n=1 Tax=Hypsizygus marmoreus TaxID=39966 RepID=A0A369JYJ5_HYPMA|nr:hypothetical protein Hypma_006213 [Hypsizygus marmoreus]